MLYDDVALPWGMLRIRERGTAGGHNGLKSMIGAIGTMEFPRVRLGVQPEHPMATWRNMCFARCARRNWKSPRK